uniref:Uncharacterized protein n=1 Tax=Setaria italica TaxID=4555 RepID=K3Y3V4_SETIT
MQLWNEVHVPVHFVTHLHVSRPTLIQITHSYSEGN